MHSVNIETAKEIIVGVAIGANEPVMMWGQPGIGKSQIMAQLAKRYHAYLVDIRLSQYDSVDMRGIPTIDNHQTVWNPPSTLPFKGNPRFDENADLILLFLDEINSAAPATSAVAYQLVNDRRVGEHELMSNVRIVAAGNREGDKGITNKMPTPLANRFTHIELKLDVDAVSEHFTRIGLPQEGVAFLNFRKPLLSTFIVEQGGKPTVTLEKAFATPRTWEKALRYFASTTMSDAAKTVAMAGAIGDGPTGEFWGFVKIYHEIKNLIPSILKNPLTAEVPQERSLMYAVAVALSGDMSAKNVSKIHQYLLRLDAEFVVLAWQLATTRDEDLFATDEFMDYSDKYKAVFFKSKSK